MPSGPSSSFCERRYITFTRTKRVVANEGSSVRLYECGDKETVHRTRKIENDGEIATPEKWKRR
jgi:hypothetical protein